MKLTSTTSKRGFGHRVNAWLDEPHGETFKHGKWRFWFPDLVGFSILNALLTAVVFGSGGNLQTYLGAIILSVGALLAWLGIGALHYSDSHDRQLARGVSALDSVTLIFVIAHFCYHPNKSFKATNRFVDRTVGWRCLLSANLFAQ